MPPRDRALGDELLAVTARMTRWATRLAELEVPPAQARLLAQVGELGPARVGDLARADHCSQPTMTAQLHRLEARGWIERSADPDDARAALIALSARGRAALGAVRQARVAVVQPVLERLSPEQLRRLGDAVDVLHELLDVAAEAPDKPESITKRTKLRYS